MDAILICLPTPLTEHREPDLSAVLGAAESLAQRLRPGQLVVLESTTYPGTTREELAPVLGALGPEGRPRLPPGLLARARGPRPHRLDHRRPPRRSSAASRPSAPGARWSSTAWRATTLVPGQQPRGGRAHQAAREHLPQRQHRPRQRAGDALRPDGHRRLGRDRRRRDQALRLHAVPARPRPRRALHPDRPLLPHLEGARVRPPHRVHRARRQGQLADAAVLRRRRSGGRSTAGARRSTAAACW